MKADTHNKKADTTEVVARDDKPAPEIPLSVANAHAQMLLAGVQMSAAAAIPAGTDVATFASDNPANPKSNNETVLAAADQLNDVDKALRESNLPAAAANPPPAPAATMTGESSIWGQTSLIGKIFIGFGALLTMASAARMFIA